jgi:hypothetical protein
MSDQGTSRRTENPLLSIREVARQLDLGVEAAAEVIARGSIPSIDGGQLAEQGRYDVPVVRRSRLEQLREQWDSELGQSTRIDSDVEEGLHPAAVSAISFLYAVSEGLKDGVFALSSARTRETADSAKELTRIWKQRIGREALRKGGIASGVYPYPEENAVIIRVVKDPGPISFRVERMTMMPLYTLLPLVEEEGVWRADLPLFEQQEDLMPHAGLAQGSAEASASSPSCS